MITSQAGAWDSEQCEYSYQRFCEYTVDSLKARFASLDDGAIDELKAIPSLFGYEDANHAYRIGSLRRIRRSDSRIYIEFDFDPRLPRISYATIDQHRFALGIGERFELNRTHWAVKTADLFSVLVRAGSLSLQPTRGLPSQIPVAILSAVSDVLSSRYTDAKLRAMFSAASITVPGDKSNKSDLCAGAFAWANHNVDAPLQVLEEMIAEVMSEQPTDQDGFSAAMERRRQVNASLASRGLAFRNGRVVDGVALDLSGLSIGAPLGAGTYGEVFRAKDAFGREVAVKFMHEDRADLEVIMGHARALALANHPAVVTLYTVGAAVHPTTGVAMPVIAMELLEGLALDDYLSSSSLLDATIRSWALQLLDVLDTLHSQRTFHGDLHAGNLLVTKHGLRVIDILYRASIANLSTRSFENHAAQDVREARIVVASMLERACNGAARAEIFRRECVGLQPTTDTLRSSLAAVLSTTADGK